MQFIYKQLSEFRHTKHEKIGQFLRIYARFVSPKQKNLDKFILIKGLCGRYKIRTYDPPDSKSGCSKP